MGSADYLKLGSWNIRCDRCGRKLKGDEARKTWNGLWVCPEHWEPRQSQDFVRSIPEDPTPPFVRNPPDIFIGLCGPSGRSSYPDTAVAGCWIAGWIDPALDLPENQGYVCTSRGRSSIASWAVASCWIAQYIDPQA